MCLCGHQICSPPLLLARAPTPPDLAEGWGSWRYQLCGNGNMGSGRSSLCPLEGGGLILREGALHPELVPGMLGAGALALLSRLCVQTEMWSAPGRGTVNPHHGPDGFRGERESPWPQAVGCSAGQRWMDPRCDSWVSS